MFIPVAITSLAAPFVAKFSFDVSKKLADSLENCAAGGLPPLVYLIFTPALMLLKGYTMFAVTAYSTMFGLKAIFNTCSYIVKSMESVESKEVDNSQNQPKYCESDLENNNSVEYIGSLPAEELAQ